MLCEFCCLLNTDTDDIYYLKICGVVIVVLLMIIVSSHHKIPDYYNPIHYLLENTYSLYKNVCNYNVILYMQIKKQECEIKLHNKFFY